MSWSFQVATLSYPSGYQVTYEYSGDLRALTALRETSTNNLLWQAHERHANGQTTQASLDGVVNIARQFGPLTGLLTDIQAGPNASPTTLVDVSYDYDVLGNLTSRYDANEILSESFQYDGLNRLTQATTGATVHTVDYNAIGNITSKRRLGSSASNTYSYPATGLARPHAVSSVTGVINGVTNPSYSYDANGNMTSGAGRTLTWQSFNQVATVTEGVTTLSYTYDAEHQRIKQNDGSNTIYYLNDPVSGASAEYHSASGGEWHDYLIVEGQRIGKRTQTLSPASVSHQRYIQDHLGSIALVLDNTGNLIQKMSYDAWGLRRFPDGSEDTADSINAPDSRGYTDHEHLPGSRLINMNARLYDPELGRFISADPFIPNPLRSQAYNRYSYVYNNPLAYTDPTGYLSLGNLFKDTLGSLGIGSGSGIFSFLGPLGILHSAYHVVSHFRGKGGGYVDGSTLNPESVVSSGHIARTSQVIVQPARSLAPATPLWDDQPVLGLQERVDTQPGIRQRLNPFNEFSYFGDAELRHNVAMMVMPGYDLYHCWTEGGCNAVDYGLGVLGVIPIPVAKAASIGVRGVARGGPAVRSVYSDDTRVLQGQQPPRIRGPEPSAQGPHSVLRRDSVNNRTYQAREFDAAGNPVRDVDFTNPTFPSGALRPGHPGPPHQHRFEINDPQVGPRSGYRRGGPEPML